jgi:hypothetical protein
MEYQRKRYYEDDDIRVYLEEIQENVFIHVAITHATKASIKRMKEKWGEVVMKMYWLGYEELFAYSKDRRVIDMIGGAEKIGEHEDYEVWKWALN